MKYRIIFDESQEEDIVIRAKTNSDTIKKIEELLGEQNGVLFGYSKDKTIAMDIRRVYAFYTEGGKVYALLDKERLTVKERLYTLEERLKGEFLKINQSCLISVSKIESFSTSIGASLTVTLTNGYKDYVSRRQVKAVKERLGL